MDIKLVFNANCGFTVSNETSNCVFDSLFRLSAESEYGEPDSTFVSNVVGGVQPFDRTTALVITHDHADHFDPELTTDFLQAHHLNRVICPRSVRDRIGSDFSEQILTPVASGSDDPQEAVTVGDLSVKPLRTDHCGPPGEPNIAVDHNSYIVTFGETSILLGGDLHPSVESIAELGLVELQLRAAVVPHWFLDDYGLTIIKDHIAAEHIVISHVPIADLDGLRAAIEGATPAEREALGQVFLPSHGGDTFHIG